MGGRGSYEGYSYTREGVDSLERKEERKLLKKFIEKEILKGHFIEEFPLLKENNQRDRIDAVCVEEVLDGVTKNKGTTFIRPDTKFGLNEIARGKEGDIIWIVEVKTQADKIKQALGQVLIYAELFSKGYPQYNLKKAIICPKVIDVYEEICKKFDVRIFVI